jgi:hypothetical protein
MTVYKNVCIFVCYFLDVGNIIKKIHTVGSVPNSNRKIGERCKIDNIAHIYMTVHIPVLEQGLQ